MYQVGEVHALVLELQQALGITVWSGQITLNVHEGRLKGFETRIVTRCDDGLDKLPPSRV